MRDVLVTLRAMVMDVLTHPLFYIPLLVLLCYFIPSSIAHFVFGVEKQPLLIIWGLCGIIGAVLILMGWGIWKLLEKWYRHAQDRVERQRVREEVEERRKRQRS